MRLIFLKAPYMPITILSTLHTALRTIPAFFPSNVRRQT